MPPYSLAEQRRMTVLPQFSTMLWDAASSAASDQMLTFDRRFVQRARRLKLTPEVVLAE